MRPDRRWAAWLLLLAIAAGCAPRVARPVTEPVHALRPVRTAPAAAFEDDGDRPALRRAIQASLGWLAGQPAGRPLVFGPRVVGAADLRRALERLLGDLADDPPPSVLAARVLAGFDVLESVGGADGRALVTGYYEPVLDAALAPGLGYAVPIHGLPEDLVEADLPAFDPRLGGERIAGRVEGRRLVPYWTRAEIEAGRLAGRGLELAWARDPVDVFFMEIQGSGILRLPDGRELRVGHAASNGRPYRPIGRLLVDEGHLPREAVSLQSIRAWLAAHPEARARVLRYNESYVFFRRLDGPPLGSLGVPVTPERSIATDPRLFPPAALALVVTERPRRTPDGRVEWVPLARFVLNQDAGGAIRGPGRVDLFWGRGEDAELAAGLMKQPGRLYFLAPRPE